MLPGEDNLAKQAGPKALRLVVFSLDDCRYALPLEAVERVVRSVEIAPLPKAPDIVLGIINVQGVIVPVVNVRRRFRLAEREIELTDHILIARTSRRLIALLADAVHGVVECSEREVADAQRTVPGVQYVEGVAKTREGLVLIHDLEKFLALEEEAALQEAMAHA